MNKEMQVKEARLCSVIMGFSLLCPWIFPTHSEILRAGSRGKIAVVGVEEGSHSRAKEESSNTAAARDVQ